MNDDLIRAWWNKKLYEESVRDSIFPPSPQPELKANKWYEVLYYSVRWKINRLLSWRIVNTQDWTKNEDIEEMY